jgi:hypothetical protein
MDAFPSLSANLPVLRLYQGYGRYHPLRWLVVQGSVLPMPVYIGNLSLSSRVIGWMSDMIYPALPFPALHRLRQGAPHEQHHLVGRSSCHRSLHTRILWTQVEGTKFALRKTVREYRQGHQDGRHEGDFVFAVVVGDRPSEPETAMLSADRS